MNRLLLLFLLINYFSLVAGRVNHVVTIVSDSLEMFDGRKIPETHFQLDINSAVIELKKGDSLHLLIINNDSIEHQFYIDSLMETSLQVGVGDTLEFDQVFLSEGVYIYYDSVNFPTRTYLGLAGVIIVKSNSNKSYYWNIREYQSSFYDSLSMGIDIDWFEYDPEYFTINGNSFPAINNDQEARIEGKVGDSIYLYISNVGNSIHSLHFHGYHATIIHSTKSKNHIGRSKDTFPIYPMEQLVLMIVPDKPGEYPVHDHNLVAVSGNGSYSNGMFTTILIEP
jgi:FtsP/CotA-like multicopper oxidase with cupredoxin domain